MKFFTFKNLFAIAALFSFVILIQVQAATPQVILTWRANNFYPADYAGKAVVTPGTPVTVGVELNTNGKLVDLSKAKISWFKDENLIGSGPGLKEINYTADATVGDGNFVRASINLNNAIYENGQSIMVENPTTVINLPAPKSTVAANSTVNLEAIPYFFNVRSLTDLDFSWLINNQTQDNGSNNQLNLKVGLPQNPNQQIIPLSLTIQSLLNPGEFMNAQTQLTIQ